MVFVPFIKICGTVKNSKGKEIKGVDLRKNKILRTNFRFVFIFQNMLLFLFCVLDEGVIDNICCCCSINLKAVLLPFSTTVSYSTAGVTTATTVTTIVVRTKKCNIGRKIKCVPPFLSFYDKGDCLLLERILSNYRNNHS